MGRGRRGRKKFNRKDADHFMLINAPTEETVAGGNVEVAAQGHMRQHFVAVPAPNTKPSERRSPAVDLSDPAAAQEAEVGYGVASGGKADAYDGDSDDGRPDVPVMPYRADDYEFGEYGFADDGYDYSQHFRVMGSGTYMDAPSKAAEIARARKKHTDIIVAPVGMTAYQKKSADEALLDFFNDSEVYLTRSAAAPVDDVDEVEAAMQDAAVVVLGDEDMFADAEEADFLPDDFVQQALGFGGAQDYELDGDDGDAHFMEGMGSDVDGGPPMDPMAMFERFGGLDALQGEGDDAAEPQGDAEDADRAARLARIREQGRRDAARMAAVEAGSSGDHVGHEGSLRQAYLGPEDNELYAVSDAELFGDDDDEWPEDEPSVGGVGGEAGMPAASTELDAILDKMVALDVTEEQPVADGAMKVSALSHIMDEFLEEHCDPARYVDVTRGNAVDAMQGSAVAASKAKAAAAAGVIDEEESRARRKALVQRFGYECDEDEEADLVVLEVKVKDDLDCDSVLSTYTNTENHPTVLDVPHALDSKHRRRTPKARATSPLQRDCSVGTGVRSVWVGSASDSASPSSRKPKKPLIKVSTTTGFPVGVLRSERMAKAGEGDDDDDEDEDDEERDGDAEPEPVNLGVARSRAETPEEKRARKAAAKQRKHEARLRKKATREAFKAERRRLQATDTPLSNHSVLKL